MLGKHEILLDMTDAQIPFVNVMHLLGVVRKSACNLRTFIVMNNVLRGLLFAVKMTKYFQGSKHSKSSKWNRHQKEQPPS